MVRTKKASERPLAEYESQFHAAAAGASLAANALAERIKALQRLLIWDPVVPGMGDMEKVVRKTCGAGATGCLSAYMGETLTAIALGKMATDFNEYSIVRAA